MDSWTRIDVAPVSAEDVADWWDIDIALASAVCDAMGGDPSLVTNLRDRLDQVGIPSPTKWQLTDERFGVAMLAHVNDVLEGVFGPRARALAAVLEFIASCGGDAPLTLFEIIMPTLSMQELIRAVADRNIAQKLPFTIDEKQFLRLDRLTSDALECNIGLRRLRGSGFRMITDDSMIHGLEWLVAQVVEQSNIVHFSHPQRLAWTCRDAGRNDLASLVNEQIDRFAATVARGRFLARASSLEQWRSWDVGQAYYVAASLVRPPSGMESEVLLGVLNMACEALRIASHTLPEALHPLLIALYRRDTLTSPFRPSSELVDLLASTQSEVTESLLRLWGYARGVEFGQYPETALACLLHSIYLAWAKARQPGAASTSIWAASLVLEMPQGMANVSPEERRTLASMGARAHDAATCSDIAKPSRSAEGILREAHSSHARGEDCSGLATKALVRGWEFPDLIYRATQYLVMHNEIARTDDVIGRHAAALLLGSVQTVAPREEAFWWAYLSLKFGDTQPHGDLCQAMAQVITVGLGSSNRPALLESVFMTPVQIASGPAPTAEIDGEVVVLSAAHRAMAMRFCLGMTDLDAMKVLASMRGDSLSFYSKPCAQHDEVLAGEILHTFLKSCGSKIGHDPTSHADRNRLLRSLPELA